LIRCHVARKQQQREACEKTQIADAKKEFHGREAINKRCPCQVN
jgi:hypothetical protein